MTGNGNYRILLCGVGGQGILFSTRVLADTAFSRGIGVTISETHGMAQRGGSVVSHLLLGGFRSTMIRMGSADLILGLNLAEGVRGLGHLRKGGTVILNTDPGQELPVRFLESLESVGARTLPIDATGMARALGAPVAANLIVIGFACRLAAFPLDPWSHVRETIEKISPVRFLEINLRAFDAGLAYSAAPREARSDPTG